jgi:hypothetical protein
VIVRVVATVNYSRWPVMPMMLDDMAFGRSAMFNDMMSWRRSMVSTMTS